MRGAAPVAIASLLAACSAVPAPQPSAGVAAAVPREGRAAAPGSVAPGIRCADDAGWNDPATPRRIHGDTWYVGTCGITALLVASASGHVLLDAGTEAAATQVLSNIRALGFRVEDIAYIVNSHAHHDHAGGIAALQRASGAMVVAMPDALPALRSGTSTPDDPQHGALDAFPGVRATRAIVDGGILRVGPVELTAHATPGHAPGGTSWTWRSCQAGGCVDVAFVDSLTAVSAPGYRFRDGHAHPQVVPTFRRTFDRVRSLPCDLLLTPHPQASGLWSRLGPGATRPLVDAGACRAYAQGAEQRLETRLAEEHAAP